MLSSLVDPIAFAQGLLLSLGLIVAIGAQNAFVLRQGLLGAHVGPVVAFCAAMDALLVAAGVAGLGGLLGDRPALSRALAGVGAVFLAVYGWRALRRSRSPDALRAGGAASSASRGAVLLQAAAFTLLNPHVYLDTVLLLGSVGARHPPGARLAFVAGAAAASAGWFVLLGFGARRLAPWFARPSAWQWLDRLIGAIMLVLSFALAVQAVRGLPWP
ncbi:LysE family transporter [Pseudacidovorax intermedius]|uniref:Amino acid transporter n=1 Tax=Pseudacidovorax intermedius TaxID=433924 RepID=A0A147HBR2_9BURK|nr:LysE family transporter [Pseudacidovorax intermedius]KTT27493.1 amino acid transporter [Pseudacidovorax intermedius]